MTKHLVSLTQAAKLLGDTGPDAGRRLRRFLRSRERDTGARLLVRVGMGERRPTYRVSLVALRRSCPELFEQRHRDELAQVAKRVDRHITDVKEAVEDLGAEVGLVAQAIRRAR